MEYIALSKLKKLKNNPRIIKDESFDKLCTSLKNNPDYFEARPLVLSDRTGELVIIGGNQRYEAAKKIGLTKVPCHILNNLTEEREREIIIRDNVNNGEWDYELLANEWDVEELKSWDLELPIFDDDVDDDKTKKDLSDNIIYTYKLEIECLNEPELEKLFNEIKNRGYKCKILTL